MTKYQPSFNKRIRQMLKNQKKENEKKKLEKEKKLKKSSSNLILKKTKTKKFTGDDQLKADIFFQRTISWRKKKEDKDFFKKIQYEQNRTKNNKIPEHYFKPKINKNKNRKYVKKAFYERNKDFLMKKSKSINRIEKDAYFYDYKPKLFRKKEKKVKVSNKSLF